MPRKPKPEKPSAEVLAPIPADILDQIVRDGPLTAADVETATRRFKKAVIERALGAELSHHLGYAPGTAKPELTTNHRNGTSGKTVLTDEGPVAIEVPRDREGTFEPQLIGKHERRFTGFDDKVIALYARVDSPRDSSLLEGGVCRRGLARSHQHRHRRHRRGSDGVAKPAARAALSRGVFRCPAREDSRRGDGAHQSRVSRVGRAARWQPRDPGHLDRADRRRKILDEGLHRPESPRLSGPPDCRDRPTQGHGGGACRRVSRNHPADLHRPSAATESRLRKLEAAQAARGGAAHDLYGAQRRSRPRRPRRIRARGLGAALSDDCGRLAPGLVAGDSVLRVSARDSTRHLHD